MGLREYYLRKLEKQDVKKAGDFLFEDKEKYEKWYVEFVEKLKRGESTKDVLREFLERCESDTDVVTVLLIYAELSLKTELNKLYMDIINAMTVMYSEEEDDVSVAS